MMGNVIMVRVSDGIFDADLHSSKECGFDNGNCFECLGIVGENNLNRVGNGMCDVGEFLTKACNYDGLDCNKCNVTDMGKIGNGVCDDALFNNNECGYDGGDCYCINNATAGNCDDIPSEMLMNCRSNIVESRII